MGEYSCSLDVCSASGVSLIAQQPDSDRISSDQDATVQTAGVQNVAVLNYPPLDLKQKYFYTINEMAGPGHSVGFAVQAAIDLSRRSPHGWGSGADSFGVHFANAFGRSLLRQNIAFGVRAMDGEDPRYFRLGHGRTSARIKYALARTITVRRDGGGWMPAYSSFAGSYATAFLAQSWRPEAFSLARGFRSGSVGIGAGFGSNLWQEFWPDLKKHVRFLNRYQPTPAKP